MQKILKLSTEDITAYNIGEYTNSTTDWVDYGINNDYPMFMRKLYLSSPTHQAICDSTINLSTGEGVVVKNPDLNPISNKWLNSNFPKDVVKDLISDLYIYGMAFMTVYGGSKCKYSPAIKYRIAKKNENKAIDSVYYSDDWEDLYSKGNRPTKLPLYQDGTDEDVSILMIQLDKKSFEYYAPVNYQGSINYVNLEMEISEFHIANIRNGLFPSFLINFVGSEFSVEQQNQIERDVNTKFGGSQNSGRAIISFSSSADDKASIDTVEQPGLTEQYEFLSKECTDKILIGHGLTSPLLAGIRSEGGGLGSNSEEMSQAYYLYYEAKLKHIQNYIIEMIRKVMDGNLLYAPIEFETFNPFAIDDKTQEMTKLSSEISSQNSLQEIDLIAVKPFAKKLSERIFDGILNPDALYKFIRSSNNNDLIIKKFESLDKKKYLFKPSELIKNTKDYYFMEYSFIKNNTEEDGK